MVSNIKLAILYYMVNDRKIDIYHATILKICDVTQKFNMAIKIGGLVITFVRYVGFDIDNMLFLKVKGRDAINFHIM